MEAYTSPKKLERYAFLWLMALLVFSVIAMLLGGQPLALAVLGYSSGAVYALLDLSWIVCGVAALFLAYRWVTHQLKIFGGTEKKDMAAFLIMLLAGFNLGATGLLDTNFVLAINMSYFYLLILAALSGWSAYHLWTRWQYSGGNLFLDMSTERPTPEETASASSDDATPSQSQQHSDIKPTRGNS